VHATNPPKGKIGCYEILARKRALRPQQKCPARMDLTGQERGTVRIQPEREAGIKVRSCSEL
jgi:hypothetical protein